jgi:hypothetical protein
MNADEYRNALDKLGLEQDDVAYLLNVTTRTHRRWISDAVPVPRSVALVLRFMIKDKVSAAYVRRHMLTDEERDEQGDEIS